MVPAAGTSPDATPEALIVALARTGDRGAFAELVRRHQPWIRNLMRRCCGDASLGDDLAQQVFLKAMGDIRRLREPKKFKAWLQRLAINVWRKHARKHDPLKNAEEGADELGEELADDHRTHDSPSVALDLEGALATLAAPVRLCVVLAAHEGLTHDEIASRTDLPLGTVKSHIRRGTQRLQHLLTAYDPTAQEQPS
jgi:RNA polymerase sigma-70 factor (ECF subfamily)